MVLGRENEVLGAGIGEEIDPFLGIIGGSGEVGEEVIVEEIRTVCLKTVRIEARTISGSMFTNTC